MKDEIHHRIGLFIQSTFQIGLDHRLNGIKKKRGPALNVNPLGSGKHVSRSVLQVRQSSEQKQLIQNIITDDN